MKNKETLLVKFWVIYYTAGDFNFYDKSRKFIYSIFANNLHN